MERYIRRAMAAFVIACAFSGLAAQAGDIGLSRNWKICANDVFELPQDLYVEWIPVGCETVDCCPGCPGVLDKLSWRIIVEGAPLESATLKFSGLPKDFAARLKFEGTAQGSAENLLVGKGSGLISGLPVEVAGRAAVAKLDVGLDKAWIQGQARLAQTSLVAGAADAREDSGSITIEQYYGKYRVNEYKIGFRFPICPWPLRDRIVLNNNASGDAAAVLVDARRSTGCVFEEERRGAGIIGMGSVLSNGGCRSEVAVFSDDDAMQLVPGVGAWTDFLGDTLNVNLTPDRLMAPVHVWVARPGFIALLTAFGDINNANLLYNSNNSGIGFAPIFHAVSGNPVAVATIGTGCASAPAVIGSPFFVPGQLNVYYVNGAFTGVNCGVDRNIQYVGTTANNQTLAHEFGHSMSLAHTNGDPAFPVTNVMIGGGAARTHFADGQSFRMNAHCSSTLNSNGVRAGPVRRCSNTISGNIACGIFTDTHCPPLATDVLPK